MTLRSVSLLLTASLLLSSCGAKRDVVKPAPAGEPSAQEEAFRLPEPTPAVPSPTPQEPPRHEPVVIEAEEEEKYILLNFENTDIRTIISTFSELLKVNYILTPGVSGSVTIQSYRKFPVSELFPVFQSILEINGLTAVKADDFYKIVPIDTAKQQPLDIDKGKDVSVTLDGSFVTQLIPFEHVKASDIANILRNLMPRGTDIIIYEPGNMLIVTAVPPTLLKFMKIIEALDVPETETDTVKTFVYYVENGEAKTLEGILSGLYGSKTPATPARTTPSASAAAAAARRRAATPVRTAASVGLPADLGAVSITAYEDINALIIKASPRAYLALLEVLKKIDIPPRQVLIEVMILEVKLRDAFEFGLEWLIRTGSGNVIGLKTSEAAAGVQVPPGDSSFPGGSFAALITGAHGDDALNAVLSTIASYSDINVLASPHILARDNKEARIEIGDEIPIATGLTQQPSTTSGEATTLISSGQIQYRTVGTILTVKPRITEKDMVTMEVTQEVSQLGAEVPIAGQDFQGFSTRKAETTATVESGHTLVLGGLISEQNTNSRSGIPFLSRIPILGYLFSTTSKSYEKTELVLLVTPYVISNQDEADELTDRFQNRVKTIREHIKGEGAAEDQSAEAAADVSNKTPAEAN